MMYRLRRLKYLMTRGLPTENYKMALVVRSDISMGRGKTASQCAHAAVECVQRTARSLINRKFLDTWFFLGQPKIVLKVSSEEEVKKVAEEAKKQGLIAVIIRDAGRTQLEPGTVSVVGIGPGPNSVIDSVTSDLKLL